VAGRGFLLAGPPPSPGRTQRPNYLPSRCSSMKAAASSRTGFDVAGTCSQTVADRCGKGARRGGQAWSLRAPTCKN